MRLMAIRLDGTGTASLLEGGTMCTLTDNGTGDYTLAINEPLGRLPIVVATPVTADVIVQIGTIAVNSVQILAFDATDGTTAKDADLHILIVGAEVADQN